MTLTEDPTKDVCLEGERGVRLQSSWMVFFQYRLYAYIYIYTSNIYFKHILSVHFSPDKTIFALHFSFIARSLTNFWRMNVCLASVAPTKRSWECFFALELPVIPFFLLVLNSARFTKKDDEVEKMLEVSRLEKTLDVLQGNSTYLPCPHIPSHTLSLFL